MNAQVVEAPASGVKVGDFFVCSWGYDQTNVDFYKVVGMTPSGKSVKVQKWTQSADPEQSGGPHDYVSPGGSPVMVADHSAVTPEMDFWERQEAVKRVPAPVETKRLQSYGEGENRRFYFTVNSYSSASKWDGRPQYQTGYGYGH